MGETNKNTENKRGMIDGLLMFIINLSSLGTNWLNVLTTFFNKFSDTLYYSIIMEIEFKNYFFSTK